MGHAGDRGIRADRFLVDKGYFETRSKATQAIRAGRVEVNGQVIRKPSQILPENSKVMAEPAFPWVSRAGVKLAYALASFNVNPSGQQCLDIGASTGGFTDVLLHEGARQVVAVDVGTDQLHGRLGGDPRVTSLEQQDARDLTLDHIGFEPELVVCDASFISLRKVLSPLIHILPVGTELITLVKPQFEVGPEGIGKGGLVIAPHETGPRVLAEIMTWLKEQGWEILGNDISPLKGKAGNQEYLIYGRKI